MVVADFQEAKWEEDKASKKLHKDLFSPAAKTKKKKKNKELPEPAKHIDTKSEETQDNKKKKKKTVKDKETEKVSSLEAISSGLTGKELAKQLARQRKNKKRKLKQQQKRIENKANSSKSNPSKNKSKQDTPKPKKERNKYKALAGKSKEEIQALKAKSVESSPDKNANLKQSEKKKKNKKVVPDSVKTGSSSNDDDILSCKSKVDIRPKVKDKSKALSADEIQETKSVSNKKRKLKDSREIIKTKKFKIDTSSENDSETSDVVDPDSSSESDASSASENVNKQSAAHSLASKVNTLKDKMKDRLNSARFRYLNEKMYTQTGDESLQMFGEDTSSFSVYHDGFQSQVAKWPTNPVDRMIQFIKNRPKDHVVADFGCGEAQISRSVAHKVHSFDLVAVNKRVTKCDIANVPLKKKTVNIGVFCLSLMGTNLVEYLLEAHRVMKDGATLLVAEVKSRFEKVGAFVRKMEKLGFSLKVKDDNNKMFIWFEFTKTGKPNRERLPEIELKPCTYKKR